MVKRAHIEDGRVMNISVVAALAEGEIEATGAAIGDLYENGQFVRPAPAPREPQEILRECQEGAQKRLDDFARTRNYDDILSACTYAASPTAKFAAEGQYCILKRDETWATLYAVLAAVQGGQRPLPAGYAEIENELPALEWPS